MATSEKLSVPTCQARYGHNLFAIRQAHPAEAHT
jgi:hypothetical protein